MVASRIAAIVPAAGLSRRSGAVNKLLHPINDRPMVRQVVDRLVSLPIDPVIVVTGFEAPKIIAALAGCPVRIIHNAAFEDGMAGTIRCGVAALAEDDVDGALICLADMPYVTRDTIECLMRDLLPDRICIPVADGRRGNPVLFGRRYFSALMEISGDRGGKEILRDHPDGVHQVPVDDNGIFVDLDVIG